MMDLDRNEEMMLDLVRDFLQSFCFDPDHHLRSSIDIERNITDMEIAQIEDEQMITDHEIAILELQAK